MSALPVLDKDRVRELFTLQGPFMEATGGRYVDDPYPIWHELRERGPVHPGVLHGISGFEGPASFHGLPYPDRPHFSIFGYAACDGIYRDDKVFASSADIVDIESGQIGAVNSMLSMGGTQHRRYRSLVQPSFVPARATWWIQNWIDSTVELLIDGIESDGRAELNVDFCAAIPVLTITGSFGVPVEQALDIREVLHRPAEFLAIIEPIVAARRDAPQDDLISILIESEITDEEGVRHRLTDAEIYSFTSLLLTAGSGTTWKQMGITLTALLQRPDVLEAVRVDRTLLKPAIEESLRWMPTDPMFSRWVSEDVKYFGTSIPKGAVVHICLGSANRDPARWDRPDEFDIYRTPKPGLAFGNGPHICLGMHVARAEIATALSALLDRLPNLRLDPDQEPPRFIGFYERGATAIPVVFG